jgi:hypothetical protein
MPPADPRHSAKIDAELRALLHLAKSAFATRQTRKTLDALHAAHTLASAHGRHRHAAQLKRALSILAHGSRPRLLTRPDARLGDGDQA